MSLSDGTITTCVILIICRETAQSILAGKLFADFSLNVLGFSAKMNGNIKCLQSIQGKARQLYLYSTFQQQGNLKCFTLNIKEQLKMKKIKNNKTNSV